eukprot:5913947-Pyramimonas_sp.AAC.2
MAEAREQCRQLAVDPSRQERIQRQLFEEGGVLLEMFHWHRLLMDECHELVEHVTPAPAANPAGDTWAQVGHRPYTPLAEMDG